MTKDREITRTSLCLGNISTEFSTTNMQRIGLFGDFYDFAIDYRPITRNKIYEIHRYIMKRYKMV